MRMIDASPREVWQQRLIFLQVEEAKASDPLMKFSLKKEIDEAKRKLQELEPEKAVTRPADISRIDKYAPAELIGREDETKLLDEVWQKVQNNENARLSMAE
jgi:type IV secretory pathway VirB4 component